MAHKNTPGRINAGGHMILPNKINVGLPAGPANDMDIVAQENTQLKARIAELERLVVRDTLTPLYNRRHFMAELDRWCWRAHRYGGEYALMFIDVDNLKAVNDGHGHCVGDALLIAIAKALLASVRKSDIVARIGGDEFAILLDNIPLADLQRKGAHLAKSVAKISIDVGGTVLVPGISTGYTVIEAGAKPTELLLRADRSMYAAKKLGKG